MTKTSGTSQASTSRDDSYGPELFLQIYNLQEISETFDKWTDKFIAGFKWSTV